MSTQVQYLPQSFVLRRLHSLFGLWLVVFLVEHMLTNSQAALLIGEDGGGFISMVNWLKSLPYLPVIEITLIGVPIAFHGILGIRYAIASRANAFASDGSKPAMYAYSRNHAYTWQRLTSWILLIGIILHVFYMRFYAYPLQAYEKGKKVFMVRVSMDQGLYTLSKRLGFEIFPQSRVDDARGQLERLKPKMRLVKERLATLNKESPSGAFRNEMQSVHDSYQAYQQQRQFVEMIEKRKLADSQVIAVSKDFGTAVLLNVRNAFKDPVKCVLYTIFVLATVFHAFNGLWTFLITWGIVLRLSAQKRAVRWCVGIMVIIGFLGLSSIWGTYWINLRS